MKKYLRLPTHTKNGWIIFFGGFVLIGLINVIFKVSLGLFQIIFLLAFIIEVVAILLGKNKPLETQDK